MKKPAFYDFPGNIIIRVLVGLVFLSEGVQKFLLPDANGAGRFLKLGIPHPDFFGPVVGAIEIICGIMLLTGIFTRLATVPLLISILTAIYYTKIPTLIDKGFWTMAHDGRADFSMLMGLIFLLIYGAGRLSVDHILIRHGKTTA
jgi:putative oxidoreductase